MFDDFMKQNWRLGRMGFGEADAAEGHGFWPGEARAMERATPARKAEFSAGRTAARRALRMIGLVPFAIPMGADRAPVWPAGVVGSITHHNGKCLAVAARSTTFAGIGLDLASAEPLPKDIWPEIMSAVEQAALPSNESAIIAKLIFSAKEASYKALYPFGREIVGFDAMTITPDTSGFGFTAHLTRDFGLYRAGMALKGQWRITSEQILTILALPVRSKYGEYVAQIPEMEMECFRA